MAELLRSNDVVKFSFAQALLGNAYIKILLLDQHMSLTEGSVGVLGQRLMVKDKDNTRAGELLKEAGVK